MAFSFRQVVYSTSASALMALCVAQPAFAKPLDALLADLAEHHPRIAAQAEKLQAAEAAQNEAFAGFLPKLDLNGTIGKENTDRTKLLVASGDFDLNPTIGGATVTQNLFEGLRTIGAVDGAEARKIVAQYTKDAATQQLFFEAVSAYISVLRQVKLTELSSRNMNTLQEQLNLEDEKVQRGSGIAVDVLQAKSRLQISKERYTAFMGGLRDATARFMQIYGQSPALEEMSLPELPLTQVPASVDEAITIAQSNNPTLLAREENADAVSHQKTIARSGFLPKLDLVASANYREDAGGIQGTEVSNSVVLQGKWNLFSGGADRAKLRKAAHEHQSAIAEASDARRKVEEQVRLAWSNLTISKERADLLQNAVNIAGEVYDARTRLRDAGSDTALNVLDAENELFRAQIDEAAARYAYYESIYRLLLAMGLLNLAHI